MTSTTPESAARILGRMLGRAVVLLAIGLAALPAGVAGAQGLGLVQQSTGEPVNPNIMIVLDTSGSMSWAPEKDEARYFLRYTDASGTVQSAEPVVASDYTAAGGDGVFYEGTAGFPNQGAGHGYWLKMDRVVDLSRLNVVGIEPPIATTTYVSGSRIILPYNHGYHVGDLISVFDFVGYPEEEGLYEVSYAASTFIYVNRVDGDLDAHAWRHLFPAGSFSLLIQRVRLGVYSYGDLEPRDAAETGLYDATYASYLYAQGSVGWRRGDLIMVTGMPNVSEDTLYLIQSDPAASSANPGYSYFRVSAADANNTWDWDDPDFSFSSAVDASITIQRVMPASMPMPGGPVWYFIPPSRMATTKNVLGSHVRIYEPSPSVLPTGQDDLGNLYYTFAPGDPAPDSGSGAYYSWYYRSWSNWSESGPTSEPVPDTVVSPLRPPADLVRQTSDVINWGLITFAGTCVVQNLLVEVDPDDEDQLASAAAIDGYLDVGGAGGLVPGGGSPTRAGLNRAGEALLAGWDDGTYHPSTWELDSCQECDRIYGVILMSDGQSNYCNPNNAGWSICPSSWADFPPDVTERLWQGEDDLGVFLTNVRTWVIGLGPLDGLCELSYTAYRGRTDASSPSYDCGLANQDDPRLPEGIPGVYDSSAGYAYLTASAQELDDVWSTIVTCLTSGP